MVAMRRVQRDAILPDTSGDGTPAFDPDEAAVTRPDHGGVIDAVAFRHAFRQLASTVAVMTLIGRDGRPRGMTVTSMCGLSVDPPTLLVCVDRATRTHRDLMATDSFGVDILAEHQHAIAARFARSGTDKVVPIEWLIEPNPRGLPHLDGAVVRLGCTIEAIHPAATHDIVVGRVRTIEVQAEPGAPLVYHDGAFGRLGMDRIPLELADRPVAIEDD
jgi:flavin reductase (DIM6/NTAB) family NADH-FMN oxidoreductase RutF